MLFNGGKYLVSHLTPHCSIFWLPCIITVIFVKFAEWMRKKKSIFSVWRNSTVNNTIISLVWWSYWHIFETDTNPMVRSQNRNKRINNWAIRMQIIDKTWLTFKLQTVDILKTISGLPASSVVFERTTKSHHTTFVYGVRSKSTGISRYYGVIYF